MELRLRLLGHRFVNLTCTGEGSKGSGSPLGLQGRLAQLEERLVCNQKAGGSNPPASTLPLFVGDVSALPRASLAAHSSARWPQRPLPPFWPRSVRVFVSKVHDASASEPQWYVLTSGCTEVNQTIVANFDRLQEN